MPVERLLVLLLRAAGALLLLALPAVFLPTDWMARIHAALGLGDLPRAPIVEYLTRSLSALYALHGVLFLIAASHVRRHRPIVLYLGAGDAVFGILVFAIGLRAGLPAAWVWAEGPPTVLFGALVVWLARRLPVADEDRGR